MTKPKIGVDSAETINRFIAQMRSSDKSSFGAPATPTQTSPESVPKQRNGTMFTDEDVFNGAAGHRTAPIDIPTTRSSHSTTPDRNSPASPTNHPMTSPQGSGVRPPQNTPKTNPASPRVTPARTYDDELAEVSHVVSTIVGTLDSKPLSQSIWAPLSGEYRRSALGTFSTPARDLTPVRVVEANPATNDSFTRMSFKAADSDHEIGRPLIGEHLYKPSPSKSASKQNKGISSRSQKLEDEIVPMADRGVVKAPHSADDGSPVLRADGNKVRFQVSPLPETSKPATFFDPIEKWSPASSSAHNNSLSSHMRTTSHSPQATSGSNTAQSKGLGTKPPKSVSAPQPTSEGSQKNSSTTVHINRATIPPSQQMPTTGTEADIHSKKSTASGFDDHLVTTLQKLESIGSLKPEESALLADLASRILCRTVGVEPSEASKPASTTGDMDLPNKFLDKWASTPKNTKENASLPTRATGAPSNATVKPAADRAAVSGPTRTLSQSIEASQRPPLAAKATNVVAKADEDTEDREHKTFFNAWPQLEQRGRPAAQIRSVIIKDLPRNATPSFVASLVYGGPIEWIFMRSESSATVRFMDPKDCQNYYDDTSNGVVFGKDAQGRELVCFVELGKDVDVIGGLLRGWIDTGVTRCVRAVGVDEDFGVEALRKMGERKGRRVESMEDGETPGGTRSVIWRFGKIDEAVQFKAALQRDEEWEHCNIIYATDPCAAATGVHLDK